MNRANVETWAITVGGVAFGVALVISIIFGGVSGVIAGFFLNASTALVLVGILVRIERRITQRLEQTEEATREVADDVARLTVQLAEVAVAIDPTREWPAEGPRRPESRPAPSQSSEGPRRGRAAVGRSLVRTTVGRMVRQARIRWPLRTAPLWLAFVVAVAVAVEATAGFFHHSNKESGSSHARQPNAIVQAATAAGFMVTSLETEPPSLVDAAAGAVWLLSDRGVTRLAAHSTTVTPTARLPGAPVGVATANSALWVAVDYAHGRFLGEILEFDAQTGQPIGKPLPTAEFPTSLTVGGDSIWVTTESIKNAKPELLPQLVRIDPRTGRLLAQQSVRATELTSVATVGRQLWALDAESREILRLSSTTGKQVAAPIRTGEEPEMVVSPSYVTIITTLLPSFQQRLESRSRTTGASIGPVVVLPEIANEIVADHDVWLTYFNNERASVVSVDPRSGQTTSLIIPNLTASLDIAVGAGSIWLNSFTTSRLFRMTPRHGSP